MQNSYQGTTYMPIYTHTKPAGAMVISPEAVKNVHDLFLQAKR